MFAETLAVPLAELLDSIGGQATVSTEFLGTNSFAGSNQLGESKRLVLFDIWLDWHGFLGPERFLALFGGLPLPRVLSRGKFGE